jgi:hypothetical protein
MIDVRTVYISQCISYVICVLVMASLWRQNRTQSPMFVLWLLNSLLQLTAAIAILARLVIPEPISIMLGNPLIVAGTLLQYVGLERYLEKRSSQRLNYALVLTYLCLHTWFTFGQPNLQGRILIFTVAMSALTAQAAWLTLHRVDPELRRVTRFLGITYAGMLLLSVLRLYTVVAVPPEGSSLFNSGIFSALAIMAFQMLFIAQTFSLVVMVNGRCCCWLRNRRFRSAGILRQHCRPASQSSAKPFWRLRLPCSLPVRKMAESRKSTRPLSTWSTIPARRRLKRPRWNWRCGRTSRIGTVSTQT